MPPSDRLDRSMMAVGGLTAEPDAFLRYSMREQSRLARENAGLRQTCADLTAAAETWIRLYEAALARANAAEDVVAELTMRTPRTEHAS